MQSKEDVVRAAVLIEEEGKFLLVQEGHAGAYRLWNWNQGKVEEGESIEQAAVREAKEETGFDVILVRKLNVVKNPFPGTKEIHAFLGHITGGDLKINKGEILQARWFSKEEAERIKNDTPGPWVYTTMRAI